MDLRQSFRRDADAAVLLVTVTPLLATFGASRWSWLGGPVSSLAIYALGHDQNDQEADRLPRTRSAAVLRPESEQRGDHEQETAHQQPRHTAQTKLALKRLRGSVHDLTGAEASSRQAKAHRFKRQSRHEIKNAPEFDPDTYRDQSYRDRIESYYGVGGAGYRDEDVL